MIWKPNLLKKWAATILARLHLANIKYVVVNNYCREWVCPTQIHEGGGVQNVSKKLVRHASLENEEFQFSQTKSSDIWCDMRLAPVWCLFDTLSDCTLTMVPLTQKLADATAIVSHLCNDCKKRQW